VIPVDLPTWFSVATFVGLTVLLLADLAIVARRPHEPSVKESALWVSFYVALALVFGAVLMAVAGGEYAGEFYAGWLTEYSLSIDNLFVFVIILSTFATPAEQQQRALTFGITAALIMRAIFIALGAALLSLFNFMFLVFGLVLVWTAVQLYRHRDEEPDIEDNFVVRVARRILPVTNQYVGGRLTARLNGRRVFTPMSIVLIAIGGTDILFALDSIPAVFGVTEEPFIVFAANAFALLGLRALYFLVTGLLDRLVYLSSGLAVILGFVGLKLVLHWAHGVDGRLPVISTPISLVVIALVLAITIAASLIKSARDPTARAHPGAVTGARRAEEAQKP
jgi:tellurite resistance protein TerC